MNAHEDVEHYGKPEAEPELYQCQDCGQWVEHLVCCAFCEHDSCKACKLQQVGGEDEWFCHLDCRDSWFRLKIREEAIVYQCGDIIELLDAWEMR